MTLFAREVSARSCSRASKYHWDMANRDEPREVVRTLREARRHAVDLAARGDLDGIFRAPRDAPSSFTYVVKILDVHPALGKVKGRRLMAEIGLQQFARVSDLTENDRTRILAACEVRS